MSPESIKGRVEFDENINRFWTFGDKITGRLVLTSESERDVHIRVVQGSIYCEEWAHTVDLEFKEHYRSTEPLLLHESGGQKLKHREPLDITFELTVPHHPQKKFPPSFEFKFNNVTWSVKFMVGYYFQSPDEYLTTQIERTFRVCTLPPKNIPRLSIEELIAERTSLSWSPQASDLEEGNEEIKNLKEGDLSFHLSLYRHGVPQSSSPEAVDMGLSLSLTYQGESNVSVTRVGTSIHEYIQTYGKDTQCLHKVIAARTHKVNLEQGSNNLNQFVEGLQVCGLTEDFLTEWQQITHSLKLTFACLNENEKFCIVWNLPINLLSEAEFGSQPVKY